MSRLIESIKLEDGRFHRLHYHQARVDRSLAGLYQLKSDINLSAVLLSQKYPKSGLLKCRVLYTKQIESIEFLPYTEKHPQSLKVVHDSSIDYVYKYEDRSKINSLFEQRQFCDDVLIIKNGLVTDASYSNIVFFDGFRWITPNSPLLNGTMRQFLLDAAEIKQETVTIQDIPSFKSFRLINAMHGFDGPEIEVSKIVL
jgi:4-amino-4-deoxychorismate lyase